MGTDDRVREHYSRDDLETVVLQALSAAGADVDALTVADLGGLDQLHAGGVAATEHLLAALDLSPADVLLDVGSGVGGPARTAAHRAGCRVTGIDLSPQFCALARALTERVGLADRVTFDEGSATALPYPDGSFTRAMLDHAGMNIEDKATVFAEVHRVLAPDGRLAVYEQMRVGDGELTYPLPWAEDPSTSFVATRTAYAELLAAAGFVVTHDEDRTAAGGPPPPGALTPAALFGPGFDERIGNNIRAAVDGTLATVLMLARPA